MTVTIQQRIAVEAGLRRLRAKTLAEKLAAIDYGMAAYDEARDRASKIMNRVMPKLRTAHGFYDFDGFIAGSIRNGNRNALYKAVYARILTKIAKRDGLLPEYRVAQKEAA